MLGLGHLALKLGLLVGSIQRSLGHLVAEAGLLIGCSHCGSYCTGLLIGAVHSELVKSILRNGAGEVGDKVQLIKELGSRCMTLERTSTS